MKVLVSQPQTDRYRCNRYDETPASMTCSRSRHPSQEIKDKISNLLEGEEKIDTMRRYHDMIVFCNYVLTISPLSFVGFDFFDELLFYQKMI